MRSERRLHRAAVFVAALEAARDALVPVVIGFFVTGGGSTRALVFALLGLIGSVVVGTVRWSSTSYRVVDEALHFKTGVFSPDEQTVPLARVTAFDEVRGPVQRLFGVVALHVQTAGGGAQGEIVLSAVSRGTADELRALARGVEGTVPLAEAEADAHWRLGFGALLVTAVTGPQLGVVLPLVGGGLALAGQSAGREEVLDRLPDSTGGWEQLAALAVLAVLVLALVGAIVGFGAFAVERTGRRLRLQRGYVQRRTASLEVDRVHAIRVVEGALRRPFGLCSVRLEVAGYASEPAVARTLIPLCRRGEAAAILSGLVPELPVPTGPPRRPPARALVRFVLPPAVAGLALAALVLISPAPALLAAAPVLAGMALGVVRFRAAGWWLDDGTVAARSQLLLTRTTTVALTRRLQDAVYAQSLGERRATLASVEFAVASKHRAEVEHIAAAEARSLFGRLRADAIPG